MMMDEPRGQLTRHSGETGGPPSWFDRLTIRASGDDFSHATPREDLTLSLSKGGVRDAMHGSGRCHSRRGYQWR
jgi:hypothetical protein